MQALAGRIRRRLAGGMDHDRRAAPVRVAERKAGGIRAADNIACIGQRLRHDGLAGIGQRGLRMQRDQEGQVREGHARHPAAAGQAAHQTGGGLAAGKAIHMRVGAVHHGAVDQARERR
jgi:hypothetical protein